MRVRDYTIGLAGMLVIGVICGVPVGVIWDAHENGKANEAVHNAKTVSVTPGVKKVSEPRSKRCLVDKVIDAITVRANCDGTGMTTIRQIGVRVPTGRECYAGKALQHARSEMYHNSVIKIYQDETYAPKTVEGFTNAYITTRPDDYVGGWRTRWDDFEWGNWLIKYGEADAIAGTATPYKLQATYVESQALAKQESSGKWGACTW